MQERRKLTGGERYFQQLPPKKVREEIAFNKWVDEAMAVCGFKQEIKICGNLEQMR